MVLQKNLILLYYCGGSMFGESRCICIEYRSINMIMIIRLNLLGRLTYYLRRIRLKCLALFLFFM